MTDTLFEPASVSGDHSAQTLTNELESIHELVRSRYPFVDRIAMALYESATDLLSTFVSSNSDHVLLKHYEIELAKVPSLQMLAASHQSRMVDDIPATFSFQSAHTAWLSERGYRASYTTPIFQGGQLAAFLFYDSRQAGVFTTDVAHFLNNFSSLISQLFLLQRKVVEGVIGTIQVAVGLARIRDLETGQHLDRLAHFSKIIAQAIADSHDLSDEYIEYIELFTPLHDVGKVGIPDRILLKPGKLDDEEWAVMRRHVDIGEQIMNKISAEMDIESSLQSQVMHNIVATHHERGDGSGYPRGLTMDQIPIEGRIVAVADVYDALSNVRPYKRAWTEEEIVAEMQREVSLGRLDGECVNALLNARQARVDVLTRFAEPALAGASVS